jgi:site-specific DNA-methyltransferase (adenine-specific)
MNSCEFILFLRKGKAKRINNLGSKTILKVDNVRGKLHPTQKPVELMKILIENSSNEGDVVLDPFMGSGSTGVACLNTNRNFIGIELDKNYFEIAKERLNDVEEW